ncbi:MAG: hypothetical protein M1823_005587 [Watsoniomyces obsoletus]|nr:MAG: hypothetical protein M1823_005587 [Watsoniomyces obsoletus]
MCSSGLGFAICLRLIDELLSHSDQFERLHLTVTARSKRKGQTTVSRLEHHVRNDFRLADRVSLQFEIVDLSILLSVRALASRLKKSLPRLDAVILNAGIGGFTGLHWPTATWEVLTNFSRATTWPTYKMAERGSLTQRQCSSSSQHVGGGPLRSPGASQHHVREPPLGNIFCANVFGHYMLSHYLMPLLSASGRPDDAAGRIIWISSLEADQASSFSSSDIQSLKSPIAYENSKRLTDILALTAALTATRSSTNQYFGTRGPDPRSNVKMYVAHPGICATSILPLRFGLSYAMSAAFYLARWLGSPWHTVTAYSGACAPVWLALSPQSQLDQGEAESGPGKWGSATDLWGYDRVMRTEALGWGCGGVPGEDLSHRAGRRPGASDLTQEERERFEELGRDCWQQMEDLRLEWEDVLDKADPIDVSQI